MANKVSPLGTFSVEFKRSLMAHLYRDSMFAKVLLQKLPDDFFELDQNYNVLFTALRDICETYKVIPLPKEIKRLVTEVLTKQVKDEDDLGYLLDTLERLTDPHAKIDYTPEVVMDTMYDAVKSHTLFTFLKQTPDMIDDRDYEGIVKGVYDAVYSVSETAQVEDYADTYMDAIKSKATHVERVPSGIAELDKYTSGGLPRRNLAVVMASTGAGKSAFLCAIAAHAAAEGYRVGYISLELSSNEVKNMITSNYTKIERNYLFADQKMVKPAMKKRLTHKPVIKVWDVGPQGTSVVGIGGLLETLRLSEGVILDLVIVDHFDDLKFQYGNRATHEVLGSEMQALRSVAHQNNVAIWTGTQGNRDSLSKESPDLENLSLAYSKAFPLDLLVSLSGTEDHRRRKYSRLSIQKNRLGESKKTIHLDVEFATVTFNQLTNTEARKRGIKVQAAANDVELVPFGNQADDEEDE